MNKHIYITFDLKNANIDRYNAIHKRISELYPPYAKPLDTFYIVYTDQTTTAVYNSIIDLFFVGDKLLIGTTNNEIGAGINSVIERLDS